MEYDEKSIKLITNVAHAINMSLNINNKCMLFIILLLPAYLQYNEEMLT